MLILSSFSGRNLAAAHGSSGVAAPAGDVPVAVCCGASIDRALKIGLLGFPPCLCRHIRRSIHGRIAEDHFEGIDIGFDVSEWIADLLRRVEGRCGFARFGTRVPPGTVERDQHSQNDGRTISRGSQDDETASK